MRYDTEDAAIAAAESMTEAARDARCAISYQVHELTGVARKRFVIGCNGARLSCDTLIRAWFTTDGQTLKHLPVGR